MVGYGRNLAGHDTIEGTAIIDRKMERSTDISQNKKAFIDRIRKSQESQRPPRQLSGWVRREKSYKKFVV